MHYLRRSAVSLLAVLIVALPSVSRANLISPQSISDAPESITVGLIGLGLIGFGVWRRR